MEIEYRKSGLDWFFYRPKFSSFPPPVPTNVRTRLFKRFHNIFNRFNKSSHSSGKKNERYTLYNAYIRKMYNIYIYKRSFWPVGKGTRAGGRNKGWIREIKTRKIQGLKENSTTLNINDDDDSLQQTTRN